RGHHDARSRLEAVGLRVVGRRDHQRAGAVDDTGAVAGVVDVADLGLLRVAEQRGLIDRQRLALGRVRAHLLEARRQLGEVLQRRARTGELLLIERRRSVVVEDRDEALIEATLGQRLGATLLAVDAELVALLAAEALD